MEKIKEGQIKSLLFKGFNVEEITKMMKISKEDIKKIDFSDDLFSQSVGLYSALQNDLAKLVLTEMNKGERDTNIILNSIRLQAELQEKKLALNRSLTSSSKIEKGYIYERDAEIAKIAKKGVPKQEIAKSFNVSVLSVKQAIDRMNLNLSEELKTISPSIISETIGLDKKTRMKILNDAYINKLTRKDVRSVVNEIKNKAR